MSRIALEEPIDVISGFIGGEVHPLRMRWKQGVFHITRTTARWVTRDGRGQVHHFAVQTREGGLFEIRLDTRDLCWTLAESETD